MTTAVIVGQGYVGLPLAVAAAQSGVVVHGLDLNERTVNALNAGRSHVDDISDQEVAAALHRGYRATVDPTVIASADVVVVCVPTPLGKDGQPDLSPVLTAAKTIGQHVTPGTTVILESTTHPGTTEELFAPLVLSDRLTLDRDVYIAFSPERVDPGNGTYGIQNTPKIVGGLSEQSTARATEFYELFIDQVVAARGAKEAELAKLLENTYRHVNIALVNEMLRFSHDLNIDLWNAIDCAATKPFGFQPFRPGPGVGAHCIPIDPNYLSHAVRARLGYSFRMVELAQEINDAAPQYVVTRAWQILNRARISMNGAKILLVGVTYKPNIADTRETPAKPIATELINLGASLSYLDPHVAKWQPSSEPVTRITATDQSKDFDLVIVLQAHRKLDIQLLVASSPRILDTRHAVPAGPTVELL